MEPQHCSEWSLLFVPTIIASDLSGLRDNPLTENHHDNFRKHALMSLSACFRKLSWWFSVNGLSLNPDKSEAMIVGTNKRLHSEQCCDSIALDDIRTQLVPCVKSLGVIIDNTLSFDEHIDNICKTANYHIRALRHIRKCISKKTAKSVGGAMVGARLDYCNALLHGTSKANIRKLQRVQNTLVRTVKQVNRC